MNQQHPNLQDKSKMVKKGVRALVSAAVVVAVLAAIGTRALVAQPSHTTHVVTKAIADRGSCVLCDAPDCAIGQSGHPLPAPSRVGGFVILPIPSAPALLSHAPACGRAPPTL